MLILLFVLQLHGLILFNLRSQKLFVVHRKLFLKLLVRLNSLVVKVRIHSPDLLIKRVEQGLLNYLS